MDQGERRKFLIRELLQENVQYRDVEIPAGEEEQRQLLRGLMNVRLPKHHGRFHLFFESPINREIALVYQNLSLCRLKSYGHRIDVRHQRKLYL